MYDILNSIVNFHKNEDIVTNFFSNRNARLDIKEHTKQMYVSLVIKKIVSNGKNIEKESSMPCRKDV